MHVEDTALPGVKLLIPVRHGDARGFFSETWNRDRFAAAGITAEFAQDNHSLSAQADTVRGLHFQAPPRAQGKLVRCGRGALFDVAVDIRRGSPYYGQWVGYELSFDNGRMLWIPPGFAHGFATREPGTEIVYKCTDTYSPAHDGALGWDSCGIDWGLTGDPILSDKDRAAPPLADFDSPFTWDAP
ncbi:dTDP-4-dehydrorhamnose 3,5-epimerase [Jannaschia ovalis]|uniref:dTDP-4-dehydrorhamnose 3,5-epimerase n=1 Tax=Jannaschia ovalis TaxID=3038773 RepID=A0ABY8LAJ2_9RHOB|nr:dTDP-4-dehydrorhamnose 3,5-epimerase [Jannaschia sp. GRR-S6-38]WGH77295.1 dTDP-4-dehydrorhamnose 3,5-epimerase [Jannaschia sp. GRR-S6-38]